MRFLLFRKSIDNGPKEMHTYVFYKNEWTHVNENVFIKQTKKSALMHVHVT